MKQDLNVLYKPLMRCATCGRLRWATTAHLAKYTLNCRLCGGMTFRVAIHIWLWERARVLYWYLWEHMQENPEWRPWLHPFDLMCGVWHGLHIEKEGPS